MNEWDGEERWMWMGRRGGCGWGGEVDVNGEERWMWMGRRGGRGGCGWGGEVGKVGGCRLMQRKCRRFEGSKQGSQGVMTHCCP